MKAMMRNGREFISADFTEGEITFMRRHAWKLGMTLEQWLLFKVRQDLIPAAAEPMEGRAGHEN